MTETRKHEKDDERKMALVSVSVLVPFDKICEVEEFAAKLRGEYPYAVAIFPGRPHALVRKFLKKSGLKFINGFWQGEINRDIIPQIKEIIKDFDGKLVIGKSEAETLAKKNKIANLGGIPISLLEDIRMHNPYTISEAIDAVERVFRIYSKRKNPADELARETRSRIRGHWVESKKSELRLPKKPLMTMALFFMNKIKEKDARLFNTAESTRFFNEIGYDTIIILDE